MKLLFISILLTATGLLTNAQNLIPTSGSLQTTTPLDCKDIVYNLNWNYYCANYTYNGLSHTVSGTNLYLNVNYTGGSICAGIIGRRSGTLTMKNIPKGTYKVTFRGVLSGSVVSSMSLGNLIVGGCCPVKASMTGAVASYCQGDSVKLSSTSTGTLKNYWYVNGVLKDSLKSFSYLTSTAKKDSVVLISDTTVCSDTIMKTINVLADPKLGKDTSICLDDELTYTLGLGWSSYLWNNGSTSRIEKVRNTGVYAVSVTAASGCKKSDSIRVTVIGPKLDLGPDITICKDSSTTLDAGVGLWKSQSWNNGDTTAKTVVNRPGLYVVSVYNSIGCFYNDAIKVFVDPDTILSVTGSDTVCLGESVILSVGNKFNSYKWYDGDSNRTKSFSTAGAYNITGISKGGCPVQGVGHVGIDTLPLISLGADTVLCNGTSWTIDAARPGIPLYRWQDASRKSTFKASKKGRYFVIITDQNGCKGSDTVLVDFKDCTPVDTGDGGDNTSIRNLGSDEGVVVYPNPAHDHVNITLSKNGIIKSIRLMDITGKLVVNTSVELTSETQLNVSTLETGRYILILETSEKRSFHSIFVE